MTREEAIGYLLGEYVVVHEGNEYEKELNEALDVAIKALQGDMYCPNCGVRLVPENEHLEPTQTHGRLIDADALSKKLCETTIFIKDGEVFQRMINDAPTVQADRPHGEWIKTVDGNGWNEWWVFKCSICGATIEDKHYRSWEYNFCPNCGADNKKENK